MRIGEASEASGVSVRSLRFYEDEGLIVPGRQDNGYRDYCAGTVERVRVIRSLLESGLPVRLIKEVLPFLAEHPTGGAAALCGEFLDEVRDYHGRLTERIAALTAQRSALESFLGAARPPAPRPLDPDPRPGFDLRP
ncbi:MerR family transcriptional regulator [Streptomyces sp. NPDC051555]|uniref:MerR family transcriptional regulator n=1 Tax=Streptomyces sp. NPDC051555 TaxID=3365657 RepID=UPI00378C6B48